ncbi:MAG: AsmA family protein [Rhodocyclaceae bacterium]
MRLTSLLKVLGFLLGGLATVVLGLALFIWMTFDARRTEADLTRFFADSFQRTLYVDGGVQLSLWPRPALRMKSATLSVAKGQSGFLQANEVRLRLALMPLLSRRMVISDIKASGGTFMLARDRKGAWNFQDLIASSDATARLADALDIQTLDLRDFTGEISDATTDSSAQLLNARIQAGQLRQGGAGTVRVRARLKAADPVIDGDLRLSGHYVWSSNAVGRVDDLSARLTGKIGVLSGAEAGVNIDSLSWQDAEDGTRWHARQARADMRGGWGQRSLQANGETAQIEWSPQGPRGPKAVVSFALRGAEDNSSASAELTDIAPATGGMRSTLHTKWQLRHGIVGSDGDVTSPLRIDWRAGRAEWERIQGDMAVSHPRLNSDSARARVDGSGVINLRDGNAGQIKFNAATGKDNLRVDALISQFSPLTVRLDLAAPHLDAARLLVATPGSSPDMPLAWLSNTALNGTISLDDVRTADMKIDRIRVPYSFSAGKLTSTGHRMELYGGALGGDVDYDIITRKLALTGRYDNIDLRALADDAKLPLLLRGKLSGTADITSTGGTLAALSANANGMVRVKLSQSVLAGIDLPASLREFHGAYQSGQPAARTPQASEKTELQDIAGNIGLRSGTWFTQSLASRGGWLRVSANGEATPSKDLIDMGLQVTLAGGQVPRDLADLRGKPLSLRLKGPLAQPDVRLDGKGTAAAPTQAPARSNAASPGAPVARARVP